MAEHEWMKDVRALVGKEYGRVYAWDPVNVPMIRQWCEMMGVDNPVYLDEAAAAASVHGGIVSPPTMLQPWCEPGLHMNHFPPGSTSENPYEVLKLIEAQGYASVVAVNSELEFDRYVRLGEKLFYTTRLDSVGEEKVTALGTGYFVTLVMTYFVQGAAAGGADEEVGRLLFRVFKFRPAKVHTADAPAAGAAQAQPTEPAKPRRPAPGVSDDTRFFWEGAKAGKLLIQRCKSCGSLRHPPGPVCPSCHSFEWDTLEASGLGTVYSFVVMHYPEVPPFDHPNPIALIELEEGTRLVAQLVGVKPEAVTIGQAVQVEFNTFDGDLVLPQFRPLANA
ncbi:bifunctional MaoC family dehydratase N-terminal/OB-fold nucleic acid binding domain-containing protein [Paraburkholderia sacchari]|uniref:bifunctional MaoC family dehydratase N-terminal/OB-fold nucleic acid binding domain-containing protein n=1 Tax=Paraburkholderia sacchari TaxID=159450 RepID=UPI001BCF3FB2|nr:bifunctional MaoC family dehydratase N-terminal/OB-fold nucleic acid binding domain-containing protein [Paraburkholderia sacchari]